MAEAFFDVDLVWSVVKILPVCFTSQFKMRKLKSKFQINHIKWKTCILREISVELFFCSNGILNNIFIAFSTILTWCSLHLITDIFYFHLHFINSALKITFKKFHHFFSVYNLTALNSDDSCQRNSSNTCIWVEPRDGFDDKGYMTWKCDVTIF